MSSEGFRSQLKMLEVEFENSLEEILLLKDIQRISLPSGALEDLKAGASLRIYRWAARKLIEKGLAKPAEGFLDLKTVLQLKWKERNEPGELQPLPAYFYLRARQELSKGDSEILQHLRDIYSLRLSKIMSFAAKRTPASMIENLTPEEEVLYENLLGIVNAWYEFVGGGGGSGR